MMLGASERRKRKSAFATCSVVKVGPSARTPRDFVLPPVSTKPTIGDPADPPARTRVERFTILAVAEVTVSATPVVVTAPALLLTVTE